jgi:sterol desaturase/sphingolipid hydroxylase (fatty acid hydroxylase superfamily)
MLLVAGFVLTPIGALLEYRIETPRDERCIGGFLKFMLPPYILNKPDFRNDIIYVSLMKLAGPVLIAPALVSPVIGAVLSYNVFGLLGLSGETRVLQWPLAIAFLVFIVLLQDFLTFFIHYMEHKIAPLWEIHKPHHAAEFLTPFTSHRVHPLQRILDHVVNTLPVSVFVGFFTWLLRLDIADTSVLGLNASLTLNTLSFYHLRHSHVRLGYGWLERYLISPAQHQLHHSIEKEHWDKNFGWLLSIWDRMFGTIFYSSLEDKYRMGLPAEEQRDYSSVVKLFVTPFIALAKMTYNYTASRWSTISEAGTHAIEFNPEDVQANTASPRGAGRATEAGIGAGARE